METTENNKSTIETYLSSCITKWVSYELLRAGGFSSTEIFRAIQAELMYRAAVGHELECQDDGLFEVSAEDIIYIITC